MKIASFRSKALILLMFLCVNVTVFAQEETNLVDIKSGKPTEWTTYFNNGKLKIDFKFVSCDPTSGLDNEAVVFKYTNLTQNKLEFAWQMNMYYDNVCRTCDFPEEYTYRFYLDGGETAMGSCTDEGNYILKIFSKFIDAAYSKGASLTAFKFGYLKIIEKQI